MQRGRSDEQPRGADGCGNCPVRQRYGRGQRLQRFRDSRPGVCARAGPSNTDNRLDGRRVVGQRDKYDDVYDQSVPGDIDCSRLRLEGHEHGVNI